MENEDRYSELSNADETGMAKRLYDIYVALSFLQHNTRIVKADDFSVACLLDTSPIVVQQKKKILYSAGYINYNTDEKIKIIKSNGILADLDIIEIN